MTGKRVSYVNSWMDETVNSPEIAVRFETVSDVKEGDVYEDALGIKWVIDIVLYDSRMDVNLI